MSWIKGYDGQTSYNDLNKAQKFFSGDNGDGTWSIYAQYSDYNIRLITGVTYNSQNDADTAIETYLDTAYTTSF